MGYQTAILLDSSIDTVGADLEFHTENYQGYWQSVNSLSWKAWSVNADVVVCAADDLYPDPNRKSYEIAEDFYKKFPDGYGVMQPIGDKMKGTDQICGSPWIGRKFIEKAYDGQGPYHSGYFHFYGDEELFEITKANDLLWQRDDVTQYHEHWCRPGGPKKLPYQSRNSQFHWDKDKKLFMERKDAGFPGANL